MSLFKKATITQKLILTVCSLLVGFIVMLFALNGFFLKDYYLYLLKDDFLTEAALVTEHYEDLAPSMLDYLRERNNANGFKYMIVDRGGLVYLSSVPEFKQEVETTIPKFQVTYIQEHTKELTEKGYRYAIIKHPKKEQDQIMLVQPLANNRFLIISEQLQEIRRNASIANQFYLVTGIAMLCIAIVVTYTIAKKSVRPVIELNQLTEEIANLNFDGHYKGKAKDEIGQLGDNINHISDTLDRTIQSLKEINLHLIDDMSMQRQFLANISHEFKSPVGIIKGYAESIDLHYYENESELKQFTRYIVEETDHLNHLVEDMIMLAKLDTKDFVFNFQEGNIASLLGQTLDKYEKEMNANDIQLELSLQEPIKLKMDQVRMVQVFDNILENAIRYMTKPGMLVISLEEKASGIEIVFSNPTNKYDQEEVQNLTRPFYRGENSRSRVTGGHGLGLTIVNRIIEAHKGRILLTYEENIFSLKIVI